MVHSLLNDEVLPYSLSTFLLYTTTLLKALPGKKKSCQHKRKLYLITSEITCSFIVFVFPVCSYIFCSEPWVKEYCDVQQVLRSLILFTGAAQDICFEWFGKVCVLGLFSQYWDGQKLYDTLTVCIVQLTKHLWSLGVCWEPYRFQDIQVLP